MAPANDLRLEIYIRSMIHLMGISEVKRILDRLIPELESEMVVNPELALPKQFTTNLETKQLM